MSATAHHAAPSSQKSPSGLSEIENSLEGISFTEHVLSELGKSLSKQFVHHVSAWAEDLASSPQPLKADQSSEREDAIKIGLAALGAFLQANVTGPVLEKSATIENTFKTFYDQVKPASGDATFTTVCLRWLDTDGVSVYQYIPHIELFGLAKYIFTSGHVLPLQTSDVWAADSGDQLASHLSWTRFRIYLWHYKLLTQPSLSAGSIFTKSGRWTDVATLQEKIESSMQEAENSLEDTTTTKTGKEQHVWSQDSRVQFYLEKANCHIMLGNDVKAREALKLATETSKFNYVLSGAMGKRTRFQENDISQLVVLAKSCESGDAAAAFKEKEETAPAALELNDDTLLEKIKFNEVQEASSNGEKPGVPPELQNLSPENQPKLLPEDQIILLAEATLRDSFSPADSLTSEEVLPFAVRVIEDKSTNWQIYTQALLVRSRIELARSRTLERGVLQMQAVVDQVVVDTEAAPSTAGVEAAPDTSTEGGVPSISVTTDKDTTTDIINKPTSFLPAAKPTESASPQERLRFVNALSSPPRWHLECELAYAWTSVGSLVSAMEIFKRLRLWPEIALCLATQGNMDDEDGRGSGGEEKARALLRWRLFRKTGTSADNTLYDDEKEDRLEDPKFDTATLRVAEWNGPERSPPPPNAPRLLCILGDIENDPAHYERAWDISKRRYARAQRSLGELYLQKKDPIAALGAFRLAVNVNRVSNEMWSRVGDLELRLGNFADAAEAFQRAISTASSASGGDDARTWSNLGSALLSWYREVVAENRNKPAAEARQVESDDEEEDDEKKKPEEIADDKPMTRRAAELGKPAYKLLQESLAAFKRGATIADSNWRIWDNVITLAASLVPKPDLNDVIFGLRNVLRIRKTEDCLDVDILTLLIREATSNPCPASESVYTPPRGSLEHKVISLFEDEIAPILTQRAEIWSLISRLRAWRRDYSGAMDAAEKSWRAAIGGIGMGASLSAATTASDGDSKGNWLTDGEKWEAVIARTEELVAAYENYGSRTEEVGSKWKGKARSAVRSVMGKARESWEGSERWAILEGLMEELKL